MVFKLRHSIHSLIFQSKLFGEQRSKSSSLLVIIVFPPNSKNLQPFSCSRRERTDSDPPFKVKTSFLDLNKIFYPWGEVETVEEIIVCVSVSDLGIGLIWLVRLGRPCNTTFNTLKQRIFDWGLINLKSWKERKFTSTISYACYSLIVFLEPNASYDEHSIFLHRVTSSSREQNHPQLDPELLLSNLLGGNHLFTNIDLSSPSEKSAVNEKCYHHQTAETVFQNPTSINFPKPSNYLCHCRVEWGIEKVDKIWKKYPSFCQQKFFFLKGIVIWVQDWEIIIKGQRLFIHGEKEHNPKRFLGSLVNVRGGLIPYLFRFTPPIFSSRSQS